MWLTRAEEELIQVSPAAAFFSPSFPFSPSLLLSAYGILRGSSNYTGGKSYVTIFRGECPPSADPSTLNKAEVLHYCRFRYDDSLIIGAARFQTGVNKASGCREQHQQAPYIHTHSYKRTHSEPHQQQPTTATWCGFSTIAAGQLPGFPMRCAWSLLQQQLLHFSPSSPPLPLPAPFFCQYDSS